MVTGAVMKKLIIFDAYGTLIAARRLSGSGTEDSGADGMRGES